jgi:hypothetical protein
MRSDWNLPPGARLPEAPERPPVSWAVFAHENPDAANAIERDWLGSDDALDHWQELNATRKDDAAFLAQSHHFVKAGRAWRLARAVEWVERHAAR